MPTTTQPGAVARLAGIGMLVGFFCLLCAVIMIPAGLWRTWQQSAFDSWIASEARINWCDVELDAHLTTLRRRNVYSLHCNLAYEFNGQSYQPGYVATSNKQYETKRDIEKWIAGNRPGSRISIKINPAAPDQFFVTGKLPVHPFNTPEDAWVTTEVFGGLGVLLIAASRKGVRPSSP